MRKILSGILSVMALALSLPAEAADGTLFVRGSLAYGQYDGDFGGFKDDASSYGIGMGATFNKARFFADLGLDYFNIAENDVHGKFVRTDITLTGGFRFLDRLSGFGGLRRGLQDDSSAFGDNIWTESGYFVGAGLGPFELGEPLRLSASLAYNINNADLSDAFGGGDFDYNGVSGKLRLGLAGTPHAAELRYQRFAGDYFGFDVTESFLYLAYVFSWKAATF